PLSIRSVLVTTLVVALAPLGCSDSEETTATNPITSDASTFYDSMEAAACSQLVTCGLTPDAATCRSWLAPRRKAQFLAGVSSGRIHYDGKNAAACLAAISQSKTCDAPWEPARYHDLCAIGDACTNVLVGSVAEGGACHLQEECGTGLYCDQ